MRPTDPYAGPNRIRFQGSSRRTSQPTVGSPQCPRRTMGRAAGSGKGKDSGKRRLAVEKSHGGAGRRRFSVPRDVAWEARDAWGEHRGRRARGSRFLSFYSGLKSVETIRADGEIEGVAPVMHKTGCRADRPKSPAPPRSPASPWPRARPSRLGPLAADRGSRLPDSRASASWAGRAKSYRALDRPAYPQTGDTREPDHLHRRPCRDRPVLSGLFRPAPIATPPQRLRSAQPRGFASGRLPARPRQRVQSPAEVRRCITIIHCRSASSRTGWAVATCRGARLDVWHRRWAGQCPSQANGKLTCRPPRLTWPEKRLSFLSRVTFACVTKRSGSARFRGPPFASVIFRQCDRKPRRAVA